VAQVQSNAWLVLPERLIAERGARTSGAVVSAPALDDGLVLHEAVEDLCRSGHNLMGQSVR
jgi:hypothetical protein